jgi:hypothetical protein
MFLGLILKSQEYKKYDFKTRVNHVLQDSLYEAFEVIVNKYPAGPSKYIKTGILPFGFAIWDKEKKVNPKYESDECIWHQRGHDYIRYILYPMAVDKKGSFIGDFTIDFNHLFVEFATDYRGYTNVYTYLNSFDIGVSFENDVDKTLLSKDFVCKTQVNSNWYINTDKEDVEIYTIFYYTTLSVLFRSSDKNNQKGFEITIYEKSDNADNLRMRKAVINGNYNEAMEYLKKNDIDYSEYKEEQFKEEDFKKI